jgi:hypothetical protein
MLPGLTSSPPSGADTVARPRRILTGLPANIDTQGIMLVAGVERSRPCEASAAGSQCCACIFWPTRRRPPSGERTFPRTRASNRSIQAGRHAWRLGLEAAACDDLRAWSVGGWSGHSIARVAEDDPDGFRAWRTDPDATPGGGESLASLLARVARWSEAQTSETGRVLVIADPAVIRAVVLHALAGAPETFWHLEVPPLSLSVVQHALGQWRLRQLVLEMSAD